MDNKRYWEIYETVKEILSSHGIYDENIIHRKVQDIINNNVSRDVGASTDSNT